MAYQPGFISTNSMRFILLIILTLFSAFQSKNPNGGFLVVEKNSYIGIDASSNINEFTCDIREYVRTDTLHGSTDHGKGKYIFTTNSSLSVEVKDFDCHHKYITSDFRKMLKADTYPFLVIRFLNLDEFRNGKEVKGQVQVELAGKKKTMDISYHCTETSPQHIRLQGFKSMKFSDFELKPPRKIGGLIRINEDIKVNFNLFFKKLNS